MRIVYVLYSIQQLRDVPTMAKLQTCVTESFVLSLALYISLSLRVCKANIALEVLLYTHKRVFIVCALDLLLSAYVGMLVLSLSLYICICIYWVYVYMLGYTLYDALVA